MAIFSYKNQSVEQLLVRFFIEKPISMCASIPSDPTLVMHISLNYLLLHNYHGIQYEQQFMQTSNPSSIWCKLNSAKLGSLNEMKILLSTCLNNGVQLSMYRIHLVTNKFRLLNTQIPIVKTRF